MARFDSSVAARAMIMVALFLSLSSVLLPAILRFQVLGPSVADHAILEMTLRDAPHHPPLLGAYSRFGWHHPGPLLLYALMPAYYLGGQGTWTLYATAALINLAALSGIIILLSRGSSFLALSCDAIIILLLARFLTAPVLVDAWNPYITLMPFAFFVVLAARLATGEITKLPAIALLGSFLVQSHVSYAPMVGITGLGTAILGTVRSFHRRDTPVRCSFLAHFRIALILLALSWLLPIIEQVTHHPGNMTRILSSLFSSERPPIWRGSYWAVLSQWAALPLYAAGALPSLASSSEFKGIGYPATFLVSMAAAIQLLVVSAMTFRAIRRDRGFAASLGGISILGLLIALLIMPMIRGDHLAYLYHWIVPVGGIAWIATVHASLTQESAPGWRPWFVLPRASVAHPQSLSRQLPALIFLGLVAPLLFFLTRPDPRTSIPDDSRRTTVALFANTLQTWLSSDDPAPLLVDEDHTLWPLTVGLLLQMDKRGYALAGSAAYPSLIGPSRPTVSECPYQLVVAPSASADSAQTIASSGLAALVVRPAPEIVWGSGWLPPEPWGRWAVARRAVLHLRLPTPAHLTFEYSRSEAMTRGQHVTISADNQIIADFTSFGAPWEWHSFAVDVPRGARMLVFAVSRTYRNPGTGQFFSFPIRDLVISPLHSSSAWPASNSQE